MNSYIKTKPRGRRAESLSEKPQQQQQQQQQQKRQKKSEASTSGPLTEIGDGEYVQTSIHQNVGYSRQGVTKLTTNEGKVFAYVVDNYQIPQDIEKNRKYGPLSGSTFERRVLRAYTNSQLQAKEGSAAATAPLKMCTRCGGVGHFKRNCYEEEAP